MHSLALSLTLGAFAVGGATLAQSSLIVDPWAPPAPEADSWFGPDLDAAVSPPPPAPAGDAKAAGAPAVVVGPSLVDPSSAPLAVSGFVVDPWPHPAPAVPPAAGAERSGSLPPAAESPAVDRRLASAAWASRLVEVVDPWAAKPSWASRSSLELLVDPWAR